MTTYRELQRKTAVIKRKLVEYSHLPQEIVENVIHYAKAVVTPLIDVIDEHDFNSQMSTQFDFSNLFILTRMMKAYETNLTIEEFCLCVCTFLTHNQDLQINWVFAAYDIDEDGILSRQDLKWFLRPCILHAEDMDFDGETKDLMDIVMAIVDRNNNGEIDLEEFRYLVKGNVLYIDLLGQCLPHKSIVKRFLAKLKNRSPSEVLKLFRKEFSSKEKEFLKKETSLYPFELEYP